MSDPRRSSLRGRLDRTWRWLRNRQTGLLPRLGRVGLVLRTAIRDRAPLRVLPEAVTAALLAPVRIPGPPPPPRSRPDWTVARAAGAERVAAFAASAAAPRPRVAVIADDETLAAYRIEWDVVVIRPEDWQESLSPPPAVLVVDAARDGNAGAWSFRLAWTAHPDFFLQRDLAALVEWCAARAVPTVFRTHDRGDVTTRDWADSASLFDVILVPDASTEAAYRALPDRRGQVLRFSPAGDVSADGGALLRAIREAA